jgi:hypothetical protein
MKKKRLQKIEKEQPYDIAISYQEYTQRNVSQVAIWLPAHHCLLLFYAY